MAATAWNPSDKSADITLSGSDLTATLNSAANLYKGVRSIASATSGDKVFEFTPSSITTAGQYAICFANSIANVASGGSALWAGVDANSVGWYGDGTVYCNGILATTINTYVATNNLMLAIRDIGSARLLFCRVGAGNWNNNGSADPTTGVGGINLVTAGFAAGGAFFPAFIIKNNLDAGVANFGATAYANSAPSGFSNFEAGTFDPVYKDYPPPGPQRSPKRRWATEPQQRRNVK